MSEPVSFTKVSFIFNPVPELLAIAIPGVLALDQSKLFKVLSKMRF